MVDDRFGPPSLLIIELPCILFLPATHFFYWWVGSDCELVKSESFVGYRQQLQILLTFLSLLILGIRDYCMIGSRDGWWNESWNEMGQISAFDVDLHFVQFISVELVTNHER